MQAELPVGNTDDLYKALSARITAAVLAGEADKAAGYFDDLRALVRRVVIETHESGLSPDEKGALIQRLLEHVSSLQACLPKLSHANLDGDQSE